MGILIIPAALLLIIGGALIWIAQRLRRSGRRVIGVIILTIGVLISGAGVLALELFASVFSELPQ